MAFQIVAHTSNPVQVHTLSWTIENFTKMSNSFTGPSFSLMPNGAKRFSFDLSVEGYDQNVANNYTLEVSLNIQEEEELEEQTRSCKTTASNKVNFITVSQNCWPTSSFEKVPIKEVEVEPVQQSPTYQPYKVECDVTICSVNSEVITNAKTVFTRVHESTSLKRRVLITFFRKTEQEAEFLAFREFNKNIVLSDDKLILKAKFSISYYDTSSSISSSTINRSQSSHDELVKNFTTMFESGIAHDLTVSVGDRVIPVHKAILYNRSPVFCKMLEHDMVEKRSTNIDIEDADFSTYKNFLLFLYTGEIPERDWESVLGIYSLADKYQVDSLRKECSAILSASLAVSSFCRILVLADLHCDLELMEASKVFFRGNFSKVIETGEWAQLVESKPELASKVLGSIKESST